MDRLVIILVFLALTIAVSILLYFQGKKAKRKEEEDFTRKYKAYVDELILVLKKRGFDDLLLTDFDFGDCYALKKGKKDMLSILNITKVRICQRLNLLANVPIEVKYISEDSNEKHAGQFSQHGYGRKITVSIRPHDSFETAMATLCHELTHYFVSFHGIFEMKNCDISILTEKMEIKTDILANLIGFNRMLIHGYKERQRDNVTRRVGYLTSSDCARIGMILEQYRKEMHTKKAAEEEYMSAKESLRCILSDSKKLLVTLKKVDPRIQRSERVKTPDQVRKLNEALMEYSYRDLEKELAVFESGLRETDVQKLNSMVEELQNLYQQMVQWSNSFQGVE